MSQKKENKSKLASEISVVGLLCFLAEHQLSPIDPKFNGFLEAIASVLKQSNSPLLGENGEKTLASMSLPAFFKLQHKLVALIPKLECDHLDLLHLVSALVTTGGDDLAANRPNRALRTWFERDPRRASDVYRDARAGNQLAVKHLTFALEGAMDIETAVDFATQNDVSLRREAVSALARIHGSDTQSALALDTLITLASDTSDEQISLSALIGGFDVLSRHPDMLRDSMEEVLRTRITVLTPYTINACAQLMSRLGKTLTISELGLCLEAVKKVQPDHTGTISLINRAAFELNKEDELTLLSVAIGDIIDGSEGEISLSQFKDFFDQLNNLDPEVFGSIAVKWLLEGGPAIRSQLASQISEIGQENPVFKIDQSSLPKTGEEQLFLCKKSIGFLFLAPMTASEIPLSVLQYGDSKIASEVLELIFNPLVLSYGGAMRRHIKAISEAGHPNADQLLGLLERKDQIHNDASDAEKLVELRPSEAHRQIERVRWNEDMRRSQKQAGNRSVFMELCTVQHLLYGNRYSSYISEPGGELRRVEMTMGTHSVEAELPLLNIFDPVGLQMTLYQMKAEEFIKT